jgi:tetratricopeptide (TPR) repeat protein
MPDYNNERIARYVEDDLSAEERRQFEADLQNDPSLRAGLSLYAELKASLQQRLPQDDQRNALLVTLRQMNKIHFVTSAPAAIVPIAPRIWHLRTLLYGMTAAASVILAIVLFWPAGKSGYIDRLGRTEMVSAIERGDNTDTLMQKASVYFNRQEFDKALPLLDKAVIQDSSNQQALLYRGLCKWHLGGGDAARHDLERVYNNGSLLQYEAAFYIALGYAGERNKTAAKGWLDRIPAGTPVSDKAKELADKLQ